MVWTLNVLKGLCIRSLDGEESQARGVRGGLGLLRWAGEVDRATLTSPLPFLPLSHKVGSLAPTMHP